MTSRVLPLALALLLAGDAPGEDPFLAALEGRSGPGAVAVPDFDAGAEAFSWTLRPRREIVCALAALLLRGEAGERAGPAKGPPPIPPPPSRIPADFDPAGVPVTDRLAAWVPADAAALFLPSLREGEEALAGLADYLPRVVPDVCGDPRVGRRDALRRAVERLLLPTVWGANPNIRTGTRQVAVVAADPDLRWGADVALVAEVDDASLVEFHRRSSMRWEGRGNRVLRVDGLDALSDDGSIRSFFGMRGGVAVWSTTRDLRDRILAAGEGRGESLLRPDPSAWALARRTFPAGEGGALLVVPDGFLARAHSADLRSRRAAALGCEAARLLLDARSLAGAGASGGEVLPLSCPAGGELRPVAGDAGASCSLHGTASDPVPLGDLPRGRSFGGTLPDAPSLGAVPVAARWREGALDLLVPAGPPGRGVLGLLLGEEEPAGGMFRCTCYERVSEVARHGVPAGRLREYFRRLTGLDPGMDVVEEDGHVEWTGWGAGYGLFRPDPPSLPPAGGVLRVRWRDAGGGGSSPSAMDCADLLLEWR